MLVVPDLIILNCFFCCSVNSLSFFVLLNKGQNILYTVLSVVNTILIPFFFTTSFSKCIFDIVIIK